MGKANRWPRGNARSSRRPAFFAATRLPALRKRPEFDANAAKGLLIERLGDPGQIAEWLRKQRGIIVAGGQHAGNAEAHHLGKHIEDLAAAQIDVEKNAVRAVFLNRVDDVADIRHEADNIAAEVTKNQFKIEGNEALILNNENPQMRQQRLGSHRTTGNLCVTIRRVHNSSSNVRDCLGTDGNMSENSLPTLPASGAGQ